jgi:hypothetical protein
MGGVFLILGGTFVFAPQIVAGVNKFVAALFGRGRKAEEAPQPEGAQAPEAQSMAHGQAAGPDLHPQDASEWAPPPEGPDQHEDSAVARLRREINSSWTSTSNE